MEMVRFVIREEIDLWDIIKWNKKLEKQLMKKDFYILEMLEKWTKKVICQLLEELR
jgi:hypothetical protein